MTTRTKTVATISIHALLAESDGLNYFYIIKITNFYPRSPCGERPMQIVVVVVDALISIHALLAESDATNRIFRAKLSPISIHALLAESDFACIGFH